MELNKAVHLLPENIIKLSAANTEQLDPCFLQMQNITTHVLRLDKIDPVISGNKWFKLKYYLEKALQNRHPTILTFGGAWSNHIVATAAAAERIGVKSIGIIRGEKPAVFSNTLLTAIACGMKLEFISRQQYQQKNEPSFLRYLSDKYIHPHIIPEGGAGASGIKGAAEILHLVEKNNYTHIACAVGTGTLLSGLLEGTLPEQQIIAIPVLKGFDNWLPAELPKEQVERLQIFPGYHMGGYARKTAALISFMNRFYRQSGIPTDFVYTGKLFFSVLDLIKKEYFPAGSKVLIIHSGGLQGNQSLPPGTLIF